MTLIESKNQEEQVWGLAYKIASENIDNVVNHLDLREKGGYTRKTVLFYPCARHQSMDLDILNSGICSDSLLNEKSENLPAAPTASDDKAFYLTIYIGSEDNPNFAGNENVETIARHIVEARGPSGSNTEYLYKLAVAMRTVAPGIQDEHLFTLEETVKKLDLERQKQVLSMNNKRT